MYINVNSKKNNKERSLKIIEIPKWESQKTIHRNFTVIKLIFSKALMKFIYIQLLKRLHLGILGNDFYLLRRHEA